MEEKKRNIKQLCTILSFALSAIGIIVCFVIDVAINSAFTWSLYPITSIIFVYILTFPVINSGKKGLVPALCVLTVTIIPYLYTLDKIIGTEGVIVRVGGVIACLVLIYLWLLCLIKKLCKGRVWMGIGIAILLAAPLSVLINYSLSITLSPEVASFDVWDVINCVVLFITSAILISVDFILKRKSQ